MKTSFQYELKGDRFLVYLLPADVSPLSANVKEILDKHGVEIVEIIIDRDGTNGVADHSVLIRISSDIAEVLIDNPNIILYYSCDDINPIPGRNTKSAHKEIPVQDLASAPFPPTYTYNFPLLVDVVKSIFPSVYAPFPPYPQQLAYPPVPPAPPQH